MTAARDELHGRIGTYLREAFGELVKEAPDEPAYFVPLGRIGVRVEAEAVGDDSALVEAYAWIAQRIAVDDEVARFLARRNAGMRFGALCVDAESDVILRHALFPDATSKVVLARLVEVLADTADKLDEELRARFG